MAHSRVALRMFLDGDTTALSAYHAGDRTDPAVRSYFERAGCGALLQDGIRREAQSVAGMLKEPATHVFTRWVLVTGPPLMNRSMAEPAG